MNDEPHIDGRTKEGRALRAAMRAQQAESSDEPRQDVRPNVRMDSIRAAEIRAQEIMEALDGDIGTGNELDLMGIKAPPGWEYNLKAVSVVGMENRHHLLSMKRTGWTPVPASRHPQVMPAGYDGPIEIKGLMLMEKPKILTDRARELEQREAMDQIRNAEAQLMDVPANTAPRDVRGKPILDVTREIMRPIEDSK